MLQVHAVLPLLKWLMSVSTLMLEASLVYFHVLELQVRCPPARTTASIRVNVTRRDAMRFCALQIVLADSSLDDWRIALSWQRVLQVAGELLLCAVHPPPLLELRVWQEATFFGAKQQPVRKLVPADQLLGVFMFLRCYLVCRALVLHSRLVTDAGIRSIGALNRITLNTAFVLKTHMTTAPGTTLFLFISAVWLVFAWVMRACESYHEAHLHPLLNCLWLIAVTFFAIGCARPTAHLLRLLPSLLLLLLLSSLLRRLLLPGTQCALLIDYESSRFDSIRSTLTFTQY